MELFKLQLQTTDTDRGSKLLCFITCKVTGNLCLASENRFIDIRRTDDLSIVINRNTLAILVSIRGCIRKLLYAFRCHGKTYYEFIVLHLVLIRSAFCILNIGTG